MAPEGTTEPARFEGQCFGGPLDGETVVSRFPAGFVLADKPARSVWIYDRRDDGRFVVRTNGPAARRLDPEKVIATALGDEYDVIATGGDNDR